MTEETVGLRRALVDHMRDCGALHSARVVRAFLEVPRERFLSDVGAKGAYDDAPIVIKCEGDVPISSSSQPSMMGLMLEQLDAREGDRVLEIGTGSGYNAALLASIVGKSGSVSSVDIDPELTEAARARLDEHPNVLVWCGDGDTAALASGQRFDRIIVTAAASEVSPAQFAALRDGGRIVVPLELGALQASVALDRTGDRLVSRSCVAALFMPLRGAAPHLTHVVRIGEAPVLWLRLARNAPVDADALWALLCTGGTRAEGFSSGLDAAQIEGLSCWLDVSEPAFCSMTASGAAAARGIIPSLLPAGPRGGTWFGLTFGARSRDGLALLERAGDDLAMRVYGDEAAERALRAGIAGWVKAGRPRQDDLRIEIVFGELPALAPHAILSRRLRSTFLLSWR